MTWDARGVKREMGGQRVVASGRPGGSELAHSNEGPPERPVVQGMGKGEGKVRVRCA